MTHTLLVDPTVEGSTHVVLETEEGTYWVGTVRTIVDTLYATTPHGYYVLPEDVTAGFANVDDAADALCRRKLAGHRM